MFVALQAVGDSADVLDTRILDHAGLISNFIDGYFLVIIDGWHQTCYISQLSPKSDQT